MRFFRVFWHKVYQNFKAPQIGAHFQKAHRKLHRSIYKYLKKNLCGIFLKDHKKACYYQRPAVLQKFRTVSYRVPPSSALYRTVPLDFFWILYRTVTAWSLRYTVSRNTVPREKIFELVFKLAMICCISNIDYIFEACWQKKQNKL
jgi:hypothetical protein